MFFSLRHLILRLTEELFEEVRLGPATRRAPERLRPELAQLHHHRVRLHRPDDVADLLGVDSRGASSKV